MSDAFADEFGVIGSAAAEANKDYVLKTVQERHIHFIRMWFTDVLGQMKSFAITPSELETAFAWASTVARSRASRARPNPT